MKYDLESDDFEKNVSAEDLLLAAFELISYFFTQNALVKAYYDLARTAWSDGRSLIPSESMLRPMLVIRKNDVKRKAWI